MWLVLALACDDAPEEGDPGCVLATGEWLLDLSSVESGDGCGGSWGEVVSSDGDLIPCEDDGYCSCNVQPLAPDCGGRWTRQCSDGDGSSTTSCSYTVASPTELVGSCTFTTSGALVENPVSCDFDLLGAPN